MPLNIHSDHHAPTVSLQYRNSKVLMLGTSKSNFQFHGLFSINWNAPTILSPILTSQRYCVPSQTSSRPPGVPRCMAALISYVPLYRPAEFSSILLLRRQHINPVRYSDLLTHPQSSSRKPRLQVCVLRPSATASSARGNRWGSVLGMGKARPADRTFVFYVLSFFLAVIQFIKTSPALILVFAEQISLY